MSRKAKVTNFLKPVPKASDTVLKVFRIVAFVITFGGTMWDVEEWFEAGYPILQYFTMWGELMTATYFTI